MIFNGYSVTYVSDSQKIDIRSEPHDRPRLLDWNCFYLYLLPLVMNRLKSAFFNAGCDLDLWTHDLENVIDVMWTW